MQIKVKSTDSMTVSSPIQVGINFLIYPRDFQCSMFRFYFHPSFLHRSSKLQQGDFCCRNICANCSFTGSNSYRFITLWRSYCVVIQFPPESSHCFHYTLRPKMLGHVDFQFKFRFFLICIKIYREAHGEVMM